ncbi:hypothetical protein MOQ_002713 [Trypanosoma cruzi marinkellei]|uniref:Uncharacterized protein n=1 Tax=Trypanosoma cruzi marinkellei TaxID=85056 RepID=K2NWY2_TRYCR|nr:hypothetical protein MOQ_002713 [Trypanosoma cruzi marinkellei]
MFMEELRKTLKDAHLEVLNATGWGRLLDGLAASWKDGGSDMLLFIYKQVGDFVAAVNWSEPFFTYLALFHTLVIVLVLVLTWRASAERIFVVALFVLLLGWCSSYLNEFGRLHAAEIFVEKGVNYFDRGGLFISVVYFCPIFLVALLLQGRILVQMLRLMVDTKRKQLRKEMADAAAAAASSSTTTTGGGGGGGGATDDDAAAAPAAPAGTTSLDSKKKK